MDKMFLLFDTFSFTIESTKFPGTNYDAWDTANMNEKHKSNVLQWWFVALCAYLCDFQTFYYYNADFYSFVTIYLNRSKEHKKAHERKLMSGKEL